MQSATQQAAEISAQTNALKQQMGALQNDKVGSSVTAAMHHVAVHHLCSYWQASLSYGPHLKDVTCAGPTASSSQSSGQTAAPG